MYEASRLSWFLVVGLVLFVSDPDSAQSQDTGKEASACRVTKTPDKDFHKSYVSTFDSLFESDLHGAAEQLRKMQASGHTGCQERSIMNALEFSLEHRRSNPEQALSSLDRAISLTQAFLSEDAHLRLREFRLRYLYSNGQFDKAVDQAKSIGPERIAFRYDTALSISESYSNATEPCYDCAEDTLNAFADDFIEADDEDGDGRGVLNVWCQRLASLAYFSSSDTSIKNLERASKQSPMCAATLSFAKGAAQADAATRESYLESVRTNLSKPLNLGFAANDVLNLIKEAPSYEQGRPMRPGESLYLYSTPSCARIGFVIDSSGRVTDRYVIDMTRGYRFAQSQGKSLLGTRQYDVGGLQSTPVIYQTLTIRVQFGLAELSDENSKNEDLHRSCRSWGDVLRFDPKLN